MRVSFAENGEDGLLDGLEPPVREGRYYVYRIDPRKVSIPDLVSSLYRTHPVGRIWKFVNPSWRIRFGKFMKTNPSALPINCSTLQMC